MGRGGSQSPRVKTRRSEPYATPPYHFHVGIRAYTGTSISYLGVSLSQSFFIAQIGEVPDQGSHTTKQPRTNPSSGVTGSSSLQGDVGSSESLALGFLYSHRRKSQSGLGWGLPLQHPSWNLPGTVRKTQNLKPKIPRGLPKPAHAN